MDHNPDFREQETPLPISRENISVPGKDNKDELDKETSKILRIVDEENRRGEDQRESDPEGHMRLIYDEEG